MTSGRRDWTAGSMRARRRIYDAQVIEPGPLTDDAGAKGRYFSQRQFPPAFSAKKPEHIIRDNDDISERRTVGIT